MIVGCSRCGELWHFLFLFLFLFLLSVEDWFQSVTTHVAPRWVDPHPARPMVF